MTFRRFTEYEPESLGQAEIRTSGLLFISNATLARFDYDESYIVALFYIDEKNMKLGMLFRKEITPIRYSKILKESSFFKLKSGINIDISPVLKFFGIDEVRDVFIADVEVDDEMLVIPLEDLKRMYGDNDNERDKNEV